MIPEDMKQPPIVGADFKVPDEEVQELEQLQQKKEKKMYPLKISKKKQKLNRKQQLLQD